MSEPVDDRPTAQQMRKISPSRAGVIGQSCMRLPKPAPPTMSGHSIDVSVSTAAWMMEMRQTYPVAGSHRGLRLSATRSVSANGSIHAAVSSMKSASGAAAVDSMRSPELLDTSPNRVSHTTMIATTAMTRLNPITHISCLGQLIRSKSPDRMFISSRCWSSSPRSYRPLTRGTPGAYMLFADCSGWGTRFGCRRG